MAKPASGATLDTGNSLYSALTAAGSAVWAMLEGSGNTSADSSGNGHGLSLDVSVSWSTNGGGEAVLACAGSSGTACAVTSPPAMGGSSTWSLAFRMQTTAGGVLQALAGNNSNSVLFADDGNFTDYAPSSGNAFLFSGSGAIDWHTDADWLLVVDQGGGFVRLYRNGVEVGDSPKALGVNDSGFTFSALGSGYNGSGLFALVGTMTYAYLMAGYAATSTDAGNLHSAPYAIFSSGGGGSVIPQASYYNLLLRA